MAGKVHEYQARVVWTGNTGEGTVSYRSYGRQHRVVIEGKPDLLATADPSFRGEADTHNPEDLFLAAIAGCHMLSYLALCAKRGVRVVAYEDDVRATMRTERGGGGRFEEVVLSPTVTIAGAEGAELARDLHDRAHEACFIAASCSVPIRHRATVRIAPESPGASEAGPRS